MKLLRFTGLSIILILLFAGSVKSQNEGNNTHNEQVTIISSFDPSINQAYKINTSPQEMTFSIDKPEFSFESLNISQPTSITLNPIKPVVINADKRTSTTNNTLKAGVGSLFSPYLDFFHSSGSKNDYRFDAHINELATFKNIVDYSPSPSTNTGIDLNYKKYFKYHIFNAGIGYNLKTNRYYGFKPDDFPTFAPVDRNLKQSFNHINLDLSLASNYSTNKKLNHSIDLSGYYYFDKHKSSESNVNFDFDVHKNFDVSDMLDYQELGLDGGISYYGNSDSLTSATDLKVEMTPYFNGKYGVFNFYIGLNFNLLNTTSTNFYFYPILDVNVNLIPDYLTVFIGVDGNVEKHSYYKLTDLNPWLESISPMEWGRNFTAYGGIRGNFAQKVNYSARLSWQKFNNLFFFVNTQDIAGPPFPYNKFTAVYDDGSIFGIAGEITYAANEKVNIIAGAKFNAYTLDSISDAYHKPSSEIKLGVSFLTFRKLSIWSEVYYYGKRVALDPTKVASGTTIDLDGFIDLNVGLQYSLTNSFSVFLTGNNLLNTDYQRYLNYPVHGIQIMGGIVYNF